MDFVHGSYEAGQTIAAIATPPGDGGVAIIRVSGNHALSVVEKIYSGPLRSYQTHTAHLGKILSSSGEVLDQVLVLLMLGKRSFTGEDTVEIHCHGGRLVTEKILRRVFEAGARAALPGEFTLKAFRNGKLDLAQAEAIQTLIAAKSEYAMEQAQKQLSGHFSQKIESLQKELYGICAIIEAWVDFPEEGLEFASFDEIDQKLSFLLLTLGHLIDSYDDGKKLSGSLKLVLFGPPNVGKSSLMNRLCKTDRSIVTHIAGTTRDIIEEEVSLAGLSFRIADTAGIRETEEIIEQEGIKKGLQAARQADLVLFVMDVQSPAEVVMPLLSSLPKEKTVVVINKIDLHSPHFVPSDFAHVFVSAHTEAGFDEFTSIVHRSLFSRNIPQEELLVTSFRHYTALVETKRHLEEAKKALAYRISPEFISIDLRSALRSLGTIIGNDISETLLDTIFSTFCLGK